MKGRPHQPAFEKLPYRGKKRFTDLRMMLRDTALQRYDFLVGYPSLEAILVAEEFRLIERNKSTRTHDAVLQRDGVDT